MVVNETNCLGVTKYKLLKRVASLFLKQVSGEGLGGNHGPGLRGEGQGVQGPRSQLCRVLLGLRDPVHWCRLF